MINDTVAVDASIGKMSIRCMMESGTWGNVTEWEHCVLKMARRTKEGLRLMLEQVLENIPIPMGVITRDVSLV